MDRSVEEMLSNLEGAYSPNTLKGYRCDFRVFNRFCSENDLKPFPASVITLLDYLKSSIGRRRPQTLKEAIKIAIETNQSVIPKPDPG